MMMNRPGHHDAEEAADGRAFGAGGRVEEACEVQAHLQADQLAGELDGREHDARRKTQRQPDQHLLHDHRIDHRRAQVDGRHRRQRGLRADRDQEGQPHPHPHRHVLLRQQRRAAEQGQHADERPQQRREPRRELRFVEGQHGTGGFSGELSR